MTRKFLVAMLDPDGLPRAWAAADDLALAREEARHQLRAYLAKKDAIPVEHPLEHEFTERVLSGAEVLS